LTPLPEALRALPLAMPPGGGWAQLAASIAASQPLPAVASRRPHHRFVLPAALAAAVIAAFVATMTLRAPHGADESSRVANAASATNAGSAASSVHNVANATNADDAEANAIEGLGPVQTRSHALERWLHETGSDSAPQSTSDLAASAEIEDMIGMVDVQLADQSDDAASLPLWRRRVALLEDLATLRYGANLSRFKTGLLASEATDARQATWNN